jgi:hypothetical protein
MNRSCPEFWRLVDLPVSISPHPPTPAPNFGSRGAGEEKWGLSHPLPNLGYPLPTDLISYVGSGWAIHEKDIPVEPEPPKLFPCFASP